MSERDDYFTQPVDDITIVSRAKGPRTLLTPEALEDARRRVAAGESAADVARELAIDQAALEMSLP
jgi:hypothetical protein